MTIRQSFTAVLERNSIFQEDFATEPYEAGWATEARWFVHVLRSSGENTELLLTPQLSPDGIVWCDDDDASRIIIRPENEHAPKLYSLGMTNFGQWLRLRGEVTGNDPSITLIIYLSLKE